MPGIFPFHVHKSLDPRPHCPVSKDREMAVVENRVIDTQ